MDALQAAYKRRLGNLSINEKIKNFVRSWLNVQEMNRNNMIMIHVDNNLRAEQLKQEVWYNGDPGNLQQFYESYDDRAGNSMFWRGKASIASMPIRKIHTGLPAMIVDKIADIAVDDMSEVYFYKGKDEHGNPIQDIETTARWEAIAKEHDFKNKVVKKAVKQALLGDAVFKLSYDNKVSDYPIIEVIKGSDVDYIYKRGRLIGFDFYSHKRINDENFFLVEKYRTDGVIYSLYDEQGRDRSGSIIEDLYELYPFHHPRRKLLMAVPMIINESSKFEGRGKSILSGKEGSFDSFDEVWSQWMDAIRAGRTTKYIPEDLIPKDANTGAILRPNAFDNQYIQTDASKHEDAKSNINVESPDIQSEKYLSAYVTALDQCLQGVISPSTLGIDVKKLDNAEAQREKEKTTLYTYEKITEILEKVIPQIVERTLQVDDFLKEKEEREYDVSVEFGGYANPSFEAKIEVVGNARNSGIMSIERAVEELYGDSLTKEEKAEEVNRLKEEQGYDVTESAVNETVGMFDNEIEDDVDDAEEEETTES